MTVRFLCDENVEEETGVHLRDEGIQAVHVSEKPGRSAGDSAVAKTARELDAILLTNDSDFLDRERFPELRVFYYPRNDLPAHRVAGRIERILASYPDVESLPGVFFLTGENLR